MIYRSRLFSLAARTYAQRLQDDEDHRLSMCGLLPDEREQHEREDFESRHYDFIFAPLTGSTGVSWEGKREQPGTPLSSGVPGELQSVPPGREARGRAAGPVDSQPPVGSLVPSTCRRAA